jgi:hypothetical protein
VCEDSGEVLLARDLVGFTGIIEINGKSPRKKPTVLENKRVGNLHVPTVVPAECMV